MTSGSISKRPIPRALRTWRSLREGRLPMPLVDQAVRRLLALKFKAGLFEKP